MNSANFEGEFSAAFLRLNPVLASMNGYKYVQTIWNDPNASFSPTELYYQIHREELEVLKPELEKMYYPELGICICKCPELPLPLTDQQTIAQIKERVEAVKYNLNEARLNQDDTMINYCQDELSQLWDYLSTCVTKKGHIRFQDACNRKHQLLIYRAVQKFCAKLQEEQPELAEYICQHAVIRMRCYWRAEGK